MARKRALQAHVDEASTLPTKLSPIAVGCSLPSTALAAGDGWESIVAGAGAVICCSSSVEEVAGVPFNWLEQASGDAGKFSGVSTTDHAAEMRGAIDGMRLIYSETPVVGQAPNYLETALSFNLTMDKADQAAAAMPAESAQLAIQAEKAGAAARATPDLVAVLSRELFSLADQLQQPADLVVQLPVIAELRGMRAEQASDRFACGAAALS